MREWRNGRKNRGVIGDEFFLFIFVTKFERKNEGIEKLKKMKNLLDIKNGKKRRKMRKWGRVGDGLKDPIASASHAKIKAICRTD